MKVVLEFTDKVSDESDDWKQAEVAETAPDFPGISRRSVADDTGHRVLPRAGVTNHCKCVSKLASSFF